MFNATLPLTFIIRVSRNQDGVAVLDSELLVRYQRGAGHPAAAPVFKVNGQPTNGLWTIMEPWPQLGGSTRLYLISYRGTVFTGDVGLRSQLLAELLDQETVELELCMGNVMPYQDENEALGLQPLYVSLFLKLVPEFV